jgi:predicted transcriptional regulator
MVLLMDSFSNEAYYLFFSTLSSRTNLAIIDVLRKKPKSISEISKELNQQKTVILNHIKQLEHSAVIRSEESKAEQLYSLNKEIIEPLSEILEFYASKYCPGLKECIPPEKVKQYLKKEAAKKTYIEH